jgi:hypothetical protein
MGTIEGTIPMGNALIVWTTLLLLWNSFFVAIRMWAKWQQHWSLADGVFVAGYVCTSNHPFRKSRADLLHHRLLSWRNVLPST